jgi:fructose-bisphosphate aldolase class I
MSWNSLPEIANATVEKGRGILAADESTPTCTKRFDSIGVESTEANRNAYRDMLFSTPGMEEFISGVILFDETLHQSTVKDKTPYPAYPRDDAKLREICGIWSFVFYSGLVQCFIK